MKKIIKFRLVLTSFLSKKAQNLTILNLSVESIGKIVFFKRVTELDRKRKIKAF